MALSQTYNEQTGQYEDIPDDEQNGIKKKVDPNAVLNAGQQESGAYTNTANPTATTNSPTEAWNREGFREASMSRPVGQSAADFIAQHPEYQNSGLRPVPGSVDKYILPTGEVIDLSINADAQGHGTANGWTGSGYWNGSGVSQYADAGGGGGGQAAPATAPAPSGLRDELLQRLMARADQTLNIDSATDPTIRSQVDPYAAQQERSRRNYLADLAERSAPGANLRGEQRLTQEHAGAQIGGWESELVGREIEARRAEIQSALSGVQGIVSQDQAEALQRELARMNDATQRLGIQTNANTAMRGQDMSYQQFLDQLGFNTEDRSNYWDAVNRGIFS